MKNDDRFLLAPKCKFPKKKKNTRQPNSLLCRVVAVLLISLYTWPSIREFQVIYDI